jgi:hypothetical protein
MYADIRSMYADIHVGTRVPAAESRWRAESGIACEKQGADEGGNGVCIPPARTP